MALLKVSISTSLLEFVEVLDIERGEEVGGSKSLERLVGDWTCEGVQRRKEYELGDDLP